MFYNLSNPADVLRTIKDEKIQIIDLRLTDLSGIWQRFSILPGNFDLESVERGIGFGRPSINRFPENQRSDILALPDPASAFLDPFAETPTLVMICNVRDPVTGEGDSRDPRYIAQKAEAYLQATQIGDTANFGLELDHFVFDEVFENQPTNYVRSENSKAEANPSSAGRGGPDWRHAGRRDDDYPNPLADASGDIRTQVVTILDKIGIKVDSQLQKIATNGHGETDLRFATLTRMADTVMMFKYVVDNVARQRGMTANAVMNAMFGDNGSAIRVRQSIWQGERPLFAGDGYAGSSALMRHYIAGLLEHAPALLGICAPVAAPNHRPVAGSDALANPGTLSAACRVPIGSGDRKAKYVRFRCPEPWCNPYLTFAAMLMAGIDGFHNRLYEFDPDEPIEPLYELPPPELSASIQSSRAALEADNAFLLAGGVFTPDVIDTHLNYTRAR